MKKFVLISLISIISIFGYSQTVTNNFEDGNWLYYYNLCWGIGPNDNYFGTTVLGNGQGFNNTDVLQTAQLKNNSSVCRLESPWIDIIPGDISFDHILYDKESDENVTLKVIAIEYQTLIETELFVYNYTNEDVINTDFNVSLSGNYKIQWKWEGDTKKARGELDNIVISGDNVSDPSNNCDIYVPVPPIDTIVNYYPAADTSTLAFEDLWTSYGDYDMNDLVIGYKFKVLSNSENNTIFDVYATFIIRAQGAALKNGFGFQFPNTVPESIESVTGVGNQTGYSFNSNGTEAGQSKATFIIFNDSHDYMTSWNTIVGKETSPWKRFNVHIKFAPDTETLENLDIQNWNPFLVRDGDRGLEIHLPDYLPTDLADPALFGTNNDDTQIGVKYYKSATNLPWALDIYGTFEYPSETNDISNVYLHFQDWVLSGGDLYQDWWSNTAVGYRNESLIY
mgnify:CR=1 FL=1